MLGGMPSNTANQRGEKCSEAMAKPTWGWPWVPGCDAGEESHTTTRQRLPQGLNSTNDADPPLSGNVWKARSCWDDTGVLMRGDRLNRTN